MSQHKAHFVFTEWLICWWLHVYFVLGIYRAGDGNTIEVRSTYILLWDRSCLDAMHGHRTRLWKNGNW
jgi:hypothetical protein